MKILVITGSPRKNGNSNTLAESFIKGAQEKGHNIVRFDSAFKNVHGCIACDKCGMNGNCVFDDDFTFVRDNIIDADMVVFATPIYYFAMSSQLRTVIDRFYSVNTKISNTPKKTAILIAYADTSKVTVEPTIMHYKAMTNYLGWTDLGQIVASGVWQQGAVNNTKFVQQAYELGKSL